MADPHIQIDQPPLVPAQTPLLPPTQNNIQHHLNHRRSTNQETDVDKFLGGLEAFLTILGFNQFSVLSFVISWTAFILIGVVVPVLILELSKCGGDCNQYQIKDFELEIVASQACLAAVSLGCVSHNLSKYGLRKLLFVDRCNVHTMARFSLLYIRQLKDSLGLLVFWALTCCVLKVVREVIRVLYEQQESWWLSAAILFGLVLSWSYVTTISLSASILFHLVCNLQVIHFDDYARLLERDNDVLVFIEEHIHLRYHLSKISHRFRIFLLLELFVVIASQVVTLFQTTGYDGIITLINGGDFVVSSVVQVVGVILCLHAATKISHRAQGIASVASRWHALATCGSIDTSQLRVSNSLGNLEAANGPNLLHTTYSESDLESMDYIAMPTNSQLVSYMATYQKRQAFVMYLQNNPGGITIFGWIVDRSLVNTIFFIELTLVTFVLGKTLVLGSD
ncbi:hypothetical protein JCGZ_17927 [Jatropha curcas]|uniref:Uncharacterized protein n=1 Tax=Jatropha curcas TaxID=180498 RepID=A0A067K4Q4_JATCU|nr:uncharacterized protein LOC105644776 [Jatropha curcas]KDP26769.1 hypothetical protein JCGZ_17927 [Jatropha curcas]